MPELRWRWGYLLFWLLCSLIAGGMLFHFRRKRWY
jgi:magnesium transporter